mgnify:CR=1 FL=1|tara:strand:+ start:2257 stop:2427 length:171 start_codon:yes stop_codon:yes gene_type:complete
MTKTRLTELTNEIARLKQIDKETTERVAAEFEAKELDEITIPCSAELDNEMANESI